MRATSHLIEGHVSAGLPIDQIESFLEHLRHAGYAEETLRKKLWVLSAFARWMKSKNVALVHLDESVVSVFMARLSNVPQDRIRFERSVLQLLLAYLRECLIVHPLTSGVDSAIDRLYDRYVTYLQSGRGLAKNSILIYAPYIRGYLSSQDIGDGQISPHAFEATTIRNHLLARSTGRAGEFMRLMAVALRSFCHFLFLYGETSNDLYESVPTAKKWRQSTVPAFITPEQECAILAATDRSTLSGCRDYAILLLLARLGLRAGEIVSLKLDDIRWRSGELIIHGKGQMVEHMPLLSDVGEALTVYLRKGRGASTSRQVFLRICAPHVSLTGPAAIGHIVRSAFGRAGFRPASRGAAHLFRHGLATTMIRQGASMTEIAQVLRHRSQDSTAIYAKVAFEDLRNVARPWPTAGGA